MARTLTTWQVPKGMRVGAYVFLSAAAALAPWIVWLHFNQLPSGMAWHLKALWVGLDIMELLGLALSGIGLLRHWTFAPLVASFTAALLFLDAWFNVVSARGAAFREAVAMAIFAELPLTVLLLWAAVRLQRQLLNHDLADAP